MCYGDICFLDLGDMWDIFESLLWHQWHHKIASESFVCPSPTSYDFQAYSPLVCSYCKCFDHDVNSCPYYDFFDECYARLDIMIGTMNEQHEHFVREMRECGLFHETDPSLHCPRLEIDD